MHPPPVLFPLLAASLATAKSLSFFGGSQIPLGEELDVPGKNPLHFCTEIGDYSLVIQKVDLTPNPPQKYVRWVDMAGGKAANLRHRGTTLTIEAQGNFTEKVEEGAYINLSVKYGLITLIRTTADLCEQMKEVDEECPLIGLKVIKKDVEIPKEVPPVGREWSEGVHRGLLNFRC